MPTRSNRQIILTKCEKLTNIPEYYSYIDANGNEQKYSGILIKNGSSFIGKIFDLQVVNLDFHPGVKHIEGTPEYFTYIDVKGNEIKYNGEVKYDNEKNCYIGTYVETHINNKPIAIFKEIQ